MFISVVVAASVVIMDMRVIVRAVGGGGVGSWTSRGYGWLNAS